MQKELLYDSVFDAQEHYRLLLDCMARPGELRTLTAPDIHPPEGIHAGAALVGFALLNADASFHAAGTGADAVASYLRENTDAVVTDVPEADFIFMEGGTADAAALIARARVGTLPYPEQGATIVISVTDLGRGECTIVLRGPGIASENTLHISGLHIDILEAVQQQNEEFPLGIDLILADLQGKIAAIPRSSRVRWGRQ
jgi:alpha-D-ribose 1-methylphosphonate 5-triphosphate synthase subunit PhnH